MTITQVNDIFKTKYPNGVIYQKGSFNNDKSRVAVVFDKTIQPHKAYEYQYTSYVELLNKLGFNLQYKKDKASIENTLKDMEQQLTNGYEENLFFGRIALNEEKKLYLKNRITYYKELLENAVFVD